VETSELIQLKDTFGFERLRAGVYTAGQIDTAWTAEIDSDFGDWVKGRMDTLPAEQQDMLRSQPWY